MSRWYEIFRAGNYPQGDFTEADVQKVVDNYDPSHEEAPMVIGHPKVDDAAYGWVAAVKREGDKLLAQFKQVVPQFAQAVNDGRWKKVSVRLVKGEKGWTLKHVGFLGATLPGVPGLKPIQFSDQDAGSDIELDFKEDDTVTDEQRKQIEDQVRAQLQAEFAAKQQRLTDIAGFIEQHKEQLPPAVRPGLVEFMTGLAGEVTVEFSQDGKAVKQSPMDWFKGFVAGLPKAVDFKEVSGNKGEQKAVTATGLRLPAGAAVDEDALAIHNQAVEFMAKPENKGVEYEQAVLIVSRQQ